MHNSSTVIPFGEATFSDLGAGRSPGVPLLAGCMKRALLGAVGLPLVAGTVQLLFGLAT